MRQIARFLFPMEERHLLAAAKYIERNPIAAGIVPAAGEYPWSSASSHLHGVPDDLVGISALTEMAGDWAEFLNEPLSQDEVEQFRAHGATGRPLGGDDFIKRLEVACGRVFRKKKPGPKPCGSN